MSQDKQIIEAALNFTAQFGFLSRDIFFEYLCSRSERRKYSNWNNLKDSGLFRESTASHEVLFLTRKGVAECGIRAVRPRFASYIPHDTQVAHLIFELQKTGAVQRIWTEPQLRAVQWDALSIMGSKNLDKLPDAVLDLKASSGVVRIAIEMECSRKSRERYQQIAFSYVGAKNIDLIIFVGNRVSDLEVIRKAFAPTGITPALMRISDFKNAGLETEVLIKDRKISLGELLTRLLKVSRNPKCHEGVTAVTPGKIVSENTTGKIA